MRQSARIITQALEGMPEGAWQADAPHVVLPDREKMMTQISRRLTVDNFARNSVVGATVIATDSLQRWVDECGSRHGLRGQVPRENVSKKFYQSDMLAPSAWKRLRLLMRDDNAYWELMKDSLGERGYGQIQISELAGLSRRD